MHASENKNLKDQARVNSTDFAKVFSKMQQSINKVSTFASTRLSEQINQNLICEKF
jgi:hypothetical protein